MSAATWKASCATCHKQELAFTDGRAVGIGATGEHHQRGPMSLVNVAYAATLTWSAVAGQFYQSQYSTNLTQTDWKIVLGTKNIIATNGIMTTTDTNAAGSPQRFYRVVLFP